MSSSAPALDLLLDGDLADVPAHVRALATAGVAGLFSYEGPRDPFLPLAVAATVPADVLLYTNLAIALPRSPMHLAQQAWDLQRASGGRFALGLGTQVRRHVEQRFGSRWEAPVEQLREWILAIRAIFAAWQDGAPLDFVGRWTRHTYLPPLFNPGPLPVPPPIVVGAVGPRMLRMATETADGVLVHPFASARSLTEHTLPAIDAGLQAAGRARADFLLIGQGMAVVGDTEEQRVVALARARAQVGFYASTPAYRVVLDVHGWGDLQPTLRDLVRQGRWNDLAAAVPDDVVAAVVSVGDPATVAAAMKARYADCDRVAVALYVAEPDARTALAQAWRPETTPR